MDSVLVDNFSRIVRRLLSEENKDKDFIYEDYKTRAQVNTKGHDYVGKKFKGNLWKFLEPSKDDKFDSNQGGNKAYFRFCETLGV